MSDVEKNVLVTAIGSMSSDVVVESLNKNGYQIFATDIYPAQWVAPSHLIENFFQVPLANLIDFIPAILKICIENNIKHLIPLTDLEVDIFADKEKLFKKHDINLCMSNKQSIDICRNKKKVYEFFKNDNKILPITTYAYNEIGKIENNLKIIAKIQKGRSSEGLQILKDKNSINLISNKKDYVYQPFINGDIYCVDYIRDSYGRECAVARKEILRTKNGAGTTVEVQHNKELIELSSIIGKKLNLLGCVNFEFIYSGNKYYLMDVNPRFSAGVEFSVLAGYDMIINHLKCFSGEKIDNQIDCETKIMCKRYKTIG